MKTYCIPLFLVLMLLHISCKKSTQPVINDGENHFEYILYDGITLSDITGISQALTENYDRIINDLGVENMPEVTVQIWGDYTHFLEDMEADIGVLYNGATGYIFGRSEFRMYYTGNTPLTAVHEFAHLVSMQVNPTIPNNPRWLWEAIALYETHEFINPNTLPYMVSGDYPTLAELNTDYNESDHKIYQVGYLLFEYLISTWGRDTTLDLIRSNGNFSSTLGMSAVEFESGWYEFVEETYLNGGRATLRVFTKKINKLSSILI